MRNHILLILLFLLGNINLAKSQVEHNFLIGPQKTDCDSLPPTYITSDQALEMIQAAQFRFTEDFEIRRNTGFRGANFYSCDNEQGFLIVKVDDQSIIFPDVPKKIWDEFIGSNNMEGYYYKIKKDYSQLKIQRDP